MVQFGRKKCEEEEKSSPIMKEEVVHLSILQLNLICWLHRDVLSDEEVWRC